MVVLEQHIMQKGYYLIQNISLINGDSADTSILPMGESKYGSNYKWYFFNVIPIAKNRNIVEVVNYANTTNLDGDAGKGLANYNVYFLLVDDQLKMVSKSGIWTQPIEVAQGVGNYRNTKMTLQRDYYTMLDGKVVTAAYNSYCDGKTDNVQFGTYPMTNSKWIKSWAFDSN